MSDKSRNYLLNLPDAQRVDFSVKYPGATPTSIELLYRLLALNPTERITAEDALAHPYFAEYIKSPMISSPPLFKTWC